MSDLMAHGTKAALGSPWERPLEGRLEQIAIDSEVLAGNLLGDPARRPIYPPCGWRHQFASMCRGPPSDAATWSCCEDGPRANVGWARRLTFSGLQPNPPQDGRGADHRSSASSFPSRKETILSHSVAT